MRLHWTDLEGNKELARLVTCNCKVRVAPHVGLGHLVPLSIAEKNLCNAPVGTQGMRLPSPSCSLLSPRFPRANRKRSDLSSHCSPCTLKEGMVLCTRPQHAPMTMIVVLAFGLCMIRITVQLVYETYISHDSHFTIHGPATVMLNSNISLESAPFRSTLFQTLPILQTRSEPSTESPSLTESSVTLPAWGALMTIS